MKLGRIFIATALSLALFAPNSQAQDIHYSQYYASPLNLNPAATGVMPCDMRISAIYRNQWASVIGSNAFNTFSAGVEGKFNVGSHDHYGLGLNLIADKAGASSFSNVGVAFSGSYLKKLGGRRSNDQYLVAGAQLGIGQRTINTNGLQWGTQWDGDQFNSSLASQENLGSLRSTFADVNIGLLWFMALDKKGNSTVNFGLAFSHLTKANISFSTTEVENLYMKTAIHGGGDFRVARRVGIVPNFALLIQGPSIQSNFGTSVKFDFSKKAVSDQAFHVGAYTRLVTTDSTATTSKNGVSVDAIILVTRLRFGSSNIGLSYDLNISPLRPGTRGNGAFELSYIYTLCGGRGRPMTCPTF